MSDLGTRLASRAADCAANRPRIFDATIEADRRALELLLDGASDLVVHDCLDEQLRDLLASRRPHMPLGRPALDELVQAHLESVPLSDYGRWVYFPWSRRLVHLLGPTEFHELRSDRNRYKITAGEQADLRRRRIGVVGLSVGQATALTLALEGVGGRFRLADFDTLALSNLNRLRAGVHGLGVNKAILASREMYEIDPYLEIEIFPAGIQADNIDAFLSGDGGLDLLVEECDDLYVKVRIRERARELRIAVVMETSDRGMIDIERFDREPNRPLFHGLLGDDISAQSLQGLQTPDKIPYVLRILGDTAMSTAGLASLVEIRHTISTWPQLASGVALGGALVTDVARRILLGELTTSGRFYIDLEDLIRDGAARDLPKLAPLSTSAPSTMEPSWRSPAPPPMGTGAPSDEELRWLIEHAVRAPSQGNLQPWRFVRRAGVLECHLDAGRSKGTLDEDGRASRVAIGSAVENLALAARAIGLQTSVDTATTGTNDLFVCALEFRRAAPERHPLFDLIGKRATNRRMSARTPLKESDCGALLEQLSAGAHLAFLREQGDLDRLSAIVGATDRLRLFCEPLHRDHFSTIRWSPDEVAAGRDGIDVASLELPPVGVALMRVHSHWPAMRQVERLGGGAGLEQAGRALFASSSGIALLTVDKTASPQVDQFHGGRALQRIWLAATARNLAVQPLGTLPFVLDQLRRYSDPDSSSLPLLDDLSAEFSSLFPPSSERREVLLLRLSYAEAPAAQSVRRRVDEVLRL